MIPVHAISKIVKKLGARISYDALEELREFSIDYAEKLAKNAIDLARFSGRNTVMKKDVEFAARRMKL